MRRSLLTVFVLALLAGGAGCAGSATTEPASTGTAEPAAAPAGKRLAGDYLGQELPGPEPELFAPGIVSTGMSERDVTIAADGNELYFTTQLGRQAGFSTILVARRVGGEWVWPEVAPFSGEFFDLEPAIAPSGNRLYFVSNRPRPGSNEPTPDYDIWFVKRTEEGWGPPTNPGPPLNTAGRSEFYPSVTRSGTVYFTATEEDGTEAIYRVRRSEGGFSERERLPAQVNSGKARFNAFVSPDERFLIVCIHGREDSVGGVDYYVSFRSEDDRWSDAVNMGDLVNTADGAEWSASLSPDGKLLFFMSSRSVIVNRRAPRRMNVKEMTQLHGLAMNGNPDIWWVDAGFIDGLRPEGF